MSFSWWLHQGRAGKVCAENESRKAFRTYSHREPQALQASTAWCGGSWPFRTCRMIRPHRPGGTSCWGPCTSTWAGGLHTSLLYGGLPDRRLSVPVILQVPETRRPGLLGRPAGTVDLWGILYVLTGCRVQIQLHCQQESTVGSLLQHWSGRVWE